MPPTRTHDRIVFDTLVQILVWSASWRIAARTVSAPTLRARRNEQIPADMFGQSEQSCGEASKWMIDLTLADVAVDIGVVQAPWGRGGRKPRWPG